MQPKQTREEKAEELFANNCRAIKTEEGWEVKGSKTYEVHCDYDVWECTCPDRQYRRMMCKHILLTQMTIAEEESLVENKIDHDIHLKTPTIIIC